MRSELENIRFDDNSSIKILLNPNLTDFFFWHFHPEYELVFINGSNGTRHVGDHISRFKNNDLVFIGSNIPHLNFDYGIKSAYQKIVVHIKPNFLEHALLNIPELEKIKELFDLARYGIAFNEEVKMMIMDRLISLEGMDNFERFAEMLKIFQILGNAEDKELLHQRPFENKTTRRDQDRLKLIYDFVDKNFHRKIRIQEVAELSNFTNEAFCRYFKSMTKLTFTEFVNHYRVDIAKKLLILDKNISETCYECGFESLSYFNRVFKKVTKENPMSFKKRFLKECREIA